MEHLVSLATAMMEADKAYGAAHAAVSGATDPMERVRLDLVKRQALNTFVDAKLAYERALDEHNDLSLERKRAGYSVAAE